MIADFDPGTERRLSSPLALGLALTLSLLTTCGLFQPDTFSAEGTVEFLELEGGCWSISTPEERYEPVDLPEELEQDGLQVRFEAEVRTDLASVCQIGPIVELHEIEPVEP